MAEMEIDDGEGHSGNQKQGAAGGAQGSAAAGAAGTKTREPSVNLPRQTDRFKLQPARKNPVACVPVPTTDRIIAPPCAAISPPLTAPHPLRLLQVHCSRHGRLREDHAHAAHRAAHPAEPDPVVRCQPRPGGRDDAVRCFPARRVDRCNEQSRRVDACIGRPHARPGHTQSQG